MRNLIIYFCIGLVIFSCGCISFGNQQTKNNSNVINSEPIVSESLDGTIANDSYVYDYDAAFANVTGYYGEPDSIRAVDAWRENESNPAHIVYVSDYDAIASGADGSIIRLVNNPNAVNPSYEQLLTFIKQDTTDAIPANEDTMICGEYARNVHNNAEQAGIKCGYVEIMFDTGDLHACDAFNTTDHGLISIDCSSELNRTLPSYDTFSYIVKGEPYKREVIGTNNWDAFEPYPIVKNYHIFW